MKDKAYKDFCDNANDLMQSVTPEARLRWVNKAWIITLGYDEEEAADMTIFDIIHPDEMEHCRDLFGHVMSGEDIGLVNTTFVTKDGRKIFVEGNVNCLFTRGKPTYTRAIFRDVTKRKKAEEMLRESEERYKTLFESATEGILVADIETKELKYANQAICTMLGYSQEELTKMNVGDIHPKTSLEHVAAEFDAQVRGEKILASLPCLKKDGTIVYADIKAAKAIISGKEYNIGFFTEVTERKQLEQELQKSKDSLLSAQQIAHVGSWDWDILTNIISYSDEFHLIFGQHVRDFEAFLDSIHPDDRELVEKSVNEALWANKPYEVEYRIILPNEEEKVIYAQGRVTFDNAGKPVRMIGTVRDITERKQAERTLRHSEERWRSLVENAPNIIMLIDRDRKIQFINHVIAGLDVKDIIGRSIYDYIQPESHDITRETVDKVFENGEPGYYEIKGTGPDGRISWYETKMGAVKIDGKVVSIIQISSDITERKQMETATKESLAEKETLLKEVHHRVKNNMQVISSLLRLQAGTVKDKDALAMLKDSQHRIQSMALVYNKLYQSQNLARIDMADYIKELTVGLIKSYTASPYRVTASIDPSDVFLGVDMAIPCGLVINALVTNSLKYAFPENRTGQIAISLKESGNQELELVLSDNGVGIPDGLTPANTSTLGLKLATNLVQDQLDGKIELDRSQGTTFKITFRQAKEER